MHREAICVLHRRPHKVYASKKGRVTRLETVVVTNAPVLMSGHCGGETLTLDAIIGPDDAIVSSWWLSYLLNVWCQVPVLQDCVLVSEGEGCSSALQGALIYSNASCKVLPSVRMF